MIIPSFLIHFIIYSLYFKVKLTPPIVIFSFWRFLSVEYCIISQKHFCKILS
jgi:hypothetical protein